VIFSLPKGPVDLWIFFCSFLLGIYTRQSLCHVVVPHDKGDNAVKMTNKRCPKDPAKRILRFVA
jgi:hypothetical protein